MDLLKEALEVKKALLKIVMMENNLNILWIIYDFVTGLCSENVCEVQATEKKSHFNV